MDIVAISFRNPQTTRKIMVVKSPMCLVYNIAVFFIGGIFSESLVLISAVTGLYRFRKK